MREPRMTCFFSLIVWYIGEVGAMAFGRLASTIYILVGVSSLAQKIEKDVYRICRWSKHSKPCLLEPLSSTVVTETLCILHVCKRTCIRLTESESITFLFYGLEGCKVIAGPGRTDSTRMQEIVRSIKKPICKYRHEISQSSLGMGTRSTYFTVFLFAKVWIDQHRPGALLHRDFETWLWQIWQCTATSLKCFHKMLQPYSPYLTISHISPFQTSKDLFMSYLLSIHLFFIFFPFPCLKGWTVTFCFQRNEGVHQLLHLCWSHDLRAARRRGFEESSCGRGGTGTCLGSA